MRSRKIFHSKGRHSWCETGIHELPWAANGGRRGQRMCNHCPQWMVHKRPTVKWWWGKATPKDGNMETPPTICCSQSCPIQSPSPLTNHPITIWSEINNLVTKGDQNDKNKKTKGAFAYTNNETQIRVISTSGGGVDPSKIQLMVVRSIATGPNFSAPLANSRSTHCSAEV